MYPSGVIDRGVMIPDLLRARPELRPVLDRYGLRNCGGRFGPVESLEFFARSHEVPLDRLLTELNQAGPHAPPAAAPIPVADRIYRPFFKAGIVVVLTLGATWGAYLLIRIALTGSFRAAGLHEVNAHGHAQIFGWVGLFVMGFAYQAFPRFKHTTLWRPDLALASFWLMLVGLVVRALTEPFAKAVPELTAFVFTAGLMEVLAAGMFVTVIVATLRGSEKPLAHYDWYILAALGWFFVQAVYDVVYAVATLQTTDPEALVQLVATWQGPLREIQIHGFAMLMILGVSQRLFHYFYGLPAPSSGLSRWVCLLLNAALVGLLAGFLLMRTEGRGWAGLWYGSVLLMTMSVVVLVRNWRIFSKAQWPDRSLKFLRAGYVWLFISLSMLVLLPVYQFVVLPAFAAEGAATKMGFSHAYYGAIRHAITVGFISLMIMGVASKVVPMLNGLDLHRLSPLWAPFVLVNLGCACRVLCQTLTDFTPNAFVLAGASGVLEVTGLALWGVHLIRIMTGRLKLPESAPAAPKAEIEANDRVGEVLERYPELLETFISRGFGPLANPVLRRTVARRVTISQACLNVGIDAEEFITLLNARRPRPKMALRLVH
jgi:hypothetical protein